MNNYYKPTSLNNQLAIFVPIERKWMEMAFEYFKQGNDLLYFYTDSRIGNIDINEVKKIYFKLKGEKFVTAKADLVEITTKRPVENILEVNANVKAKYFYAYKNLKYLEQKILLEDIKRYPSGKYLRNDTPDICVINDPLNN